MHTNDDLEANQPVAEQELKDKQEPGKPGRRYVVPAMVGWVSGLIWTFGLGGVIGGAVWGLTRPRYHAKVEDGGLLDVLNGGDSQEFSSYMVYVGVVGFMVAAFTWLSLWRAGKRQQQTWWAALVGCSVWLAVVFKQAGDVVGSMFQDVPNDVAPGMDVTIVPQIPGLHGYLFAAFISSVVYWLYQAQRVDTIN